MREKFNGVYMARGRLATVNSARGFRVYNEKLFREGGKEYRMWDPFRSKLAAAILNGLRRLPIQKSSDVLYLGASGGTTASHVADMTEGMVYCVEFSKRMMHELLPVCEAKKNMIPILGDAMRPQTYMNSIGSVDFIYQDVAQRDQAGILIKNIKTFSPSDAMITIKARSIDSAVNPEKIFKDEVGKLKAQYNVTEVINLSPYIKDHVLASVKVK